MKIGGLDRSEMLAIEIGKDHHPARGGEACWVLLSKR